MRSSVASEAEAAEQSLESPTILLLDDDSTTLLVLHTILEGTKARVIECENELCAVRQSQELSNGIDVLVADVVLDGGNGPDVVRKIKPSQPLMRLLFISGFSLPDLERRGLLSQEELSPGSVEFLQKPFSSEEFLARITQLLPN